MAPGSDPSPGDHVCPWWFAYTFDNVLRRLLHDPVKLLGPLVGEGMTVVDIGCGMGHFSLGMARLVGPAGKVYAVDLQEKMLSVMGKRARKAGLSDRIVPHLCTADSLDLEVDASFALLFWMAHEVPDTGRLFREVRSILSPGGKVLYAEPSFHVEDQLFRRILASAHGAGFRETGKVPVRFSRASLLEAE